MPAADLSQQISNSRGHGGFRHRQHEAGHERRARPWVRSMEPISEIMEAVGRGQTFRSVGLTREDVKLVPRSHGVQSARDVITMTLPLRPRGGLPGIKPLVPDEPGLSFRWMWTNCWIVAIAISIWPICLLTLKPATPRGKRLSGAGRVDCQIHTECCPYRLFSPVTGQSPNMPATCEDNPAGHPPGAAGVRHPQKSHKGQRFLAKTCWLEAENRP